METGEVFHQPSGAPSLQQIATVNIASLHPAVANFRYACGAVTQDRRPIHLRGGSTFSEAPGGAFHTAEVQAAMRSPFARLVTASMRLALSWASFAVADSRIARRKSVARPPATQP